jgi:hypothetical protein
MISYLIANRNKGAIMPCALTTTSAGQRSQATVWDSTSWDREVARNRPKHFNRRRPR